MYLSALQRMILCYRSVVYSCVMLANGHALIWSSIRVHALIRNSASVIMGNKLKVRNVFLSQSS